MNKVIIALAIASASFLPFTDSACGAGSCVSRTDTLTQCLTCCGSSYGAGSCQRQCYLSK